MSISVSGAVRERERPVLQKSVDRSCMVSQLGDKLQQEAAEKTADVWPDQHMFVPWIIVNGVSLNSKQAMIDNLPYLLCDWYTGDEEIPFCSSEVAKRRSNGALKKIDSLINRCNARERSV
uniref:Transposase n=1 Tax=Angiostrongylus cantonensis TaxID=6313 RepID=A0A0K0DN55_ANGCA